MTNIKTKLIAVSLLLMLLATVFIAMGLTDSNFSIDMYGGKYHDEASVLAAVISSDTSETAFLLPAKIQEIVFSAEEYFYTHPVLLELTAVDDDIVEIYYTLDGTLPDSKRGKLYTDPIKLSGTRSDKQESHVVKARGKRADNTFTDVYAHSYFIGEKIFERFDVIVFSLSTDPHNLYDYDNGIFVGGRLRKEYIEETGDVNPNPPAPANYNLRGRESERLVYVEVLDKNGNLILSQNAGMRVTGGWSRAMDQRSIKLFARSEYDAGNNLFNYEFFPDNRSYNGLSITKYKNIVLRNNANDNPFGFIRDETILSCAEMTTLIDVQKTRPAAVFLNGEYYGFVWLHEVYDDNYLDRRNHIKDGEWVILEGGESYKAEKPDDPLNAMAIADYEEMYAYYKKGLNNDDVFNELLSRMDLNNFLTYYAIQMYVANGDWPNNNYKAYRYFGDDLLVNHIDENSTADGKWRWLIFDTDFGLGLYDCKASEQSLGILLGKYGGDREKVSPLLATLLMRQDVKEKFVEILCDLMNHQFSAENITKIMREKEAARLQELTYDFKHGGFQLKNTWSNMNHVSNELKKIMMFSIERPVEIKKQIIKYLDVKDSGYTIYVKPCKNADIMLNSCLISENSKEFKGFYYDINTVNITAQPSMGYRFSHWIVNDEIYDKPVLSITKEDAEKGNVIIKLVITNDDISAYPVIKLIDYEGSMDYIQLYNPFNTDINLKKYYITDDNLDLYKQSLPDYILKSGQTINLYCKNYKSIDALGGFSLGFNIKNNETIYITNSSGNIVEQLFLPKINNDKVYAREEPTGRYYDIPRDDGR